MNLTRHLDRELAGAALDAYNNYRYWFGLARYWRKRGARNTARSCARFAREASCRFEDLLQAAEASS